MTMAQKRDWDEEKIRFWVFLVFLVLYYIKKACVNILWQYLKYFSRYDHLYISLTTNLAFVFNWYFIIFIISSPGHRPYELLSWVSVRRPSVNFSHLNLLLWNHWTELNQTCQKCSLDGPLPDLCFWYWFEIQHGCQGPYCVLIGWNF